MALVYRGQPPAWQTKVVQLSGSFKGISEMFVPVCDNDTALSKPTFVGRSAVDDCSQTNSMHSCTVNKCCSGHCKTCRHICQTNLFKSNVTNKIYSVISHMDGGTDNIIYLVSCKKCGVQYVSETGQTLKKRLNNHRNRLKQLIVSYVDFIYTTILIQVDIQ